MILVPVPLHLEFVGIGNGQPAEQYRFAIRIDEPIALYRDQWHLGGVRVGSAPTGPGGLVPPPVVRTRRRGRRHRSAPACWCRGLRVGLRKRHDAAPKRRQSDRSDYCESLHCTPSSELGKKCRGPQLRPAASPAPACAFDCQRHISTPPCRDQSTNHRRPYTRVQHNKQALRPGIATDTRKVPLYSPAIAAPSGALARRRGPGCHGYSSQFHAESDAGRLYIEQIRDEWCSTLHSDASRASRTYAVIRVAHRLYWIYPTVSLRPCAPRFLTKEATCAGQSLYSA